MKKYQRLAIQQPTADLIRMLAGLKTIQNGRFIYNKEKSEDYAKNIFIDEQCAACFLTTSGAEITASVWVVIKNNCLEVTNIVPMNPLEVLDFRLTKDQYNHILNSFAGFICQYGGLTINDIKITPSSIILKKVLSKEEYAAFSEWADTCNIDSPISHENDEKKWFRFVCLMAKSDCAISTADIASYLIEYKQWPESFKNSLTEIELQYEYSLRLIRYKNENFF